MGEAKYTAQLKWHVLQQEKGVVVGDKRKVHIFSLLNFSDDVSYSKSLFRVLRIHNSGQIK